MSLIKSRDTSFELNFLKVLSAEIYPKGYRYRKHYKSIIGKPDIVFPGHKLAVFLDSDFWHGRDFKNLKPQLKNQFWLSKIAKNIKRDKKVNRTLRSEGWKVLRLREREIRKSPYVAVRRIEDGLKG